MQFIFSDPHFGDEGLRKKARQEFNTIEEHDEYIVQCWNKVITSKDTVVYLLGDVGYKEVIERIVPRLRGYKILILGNHDTYSLEFYKQYFDEVHDTPIYYSKRIVLSHIPIPVEDGILNIHGHTHNIDLVSKFHINASAERINYTPQKMKIYIDMLNKIPKPNYRFLQEWYKDIQIPVIGRNEFVLKKDGTIDAAQTIDIVARLKAEAKLKN